MTQGKRRKAVTRQAVKKAPGPKSAATKESPYKGSDITPEEYRKLDNAEYEYARRMLLEKNDPMPFVDYQWRHTMTVPEKFIKNYGRAWTRSKYRDLLIDDWQVDIIKNAFSDAVTKMAIKGCTKPGKGFSVALIVNIWFDIYPDSRVTLVGPSARQMETVFYAEVARMRELMKRPGPGTILSRGVRDSNRHSIIIANPETGEGLSGAHSDRTLFVFDEACHDDQTDVMTDRGWVRFSELRGDELLLTREMKPGSKAYYSRPRALIASPYKGKMYLNKARGGNFCVTPNHRMLVSNTHKKSDEYGTWKLAPIKSLTAHAYAMDREIQWQGEETSIAALEGARFSRKTFSDKEINMDRWLMFLGWYLSEGSTSKIRGVPYSTIITQSDPDMVERIKSIIRSLGYEPRVHHSPTTLQIAIHSRQLAEAMQLLGEKSYNKQVPEYVFGLSPRQIRLFLDEFMLGDGYIKDGKKVYYTSSPQMADDLHRLILKSGVPSSIHTRELAGKANYIVDHYSISSRDGYVVSELVKSKRSNYRPTKIELIDYDGTVYCADMGGTELLFTRRKGCCMWSGNSSVPDELYENALKQSRLVIAISNPRILSGWFYRMFMGVKDKNKTQMIGSTYLVTVSGEDCINVKQRRLERPYGPKGGIKIFGDKYKDGQKIPEGVYQYIKPAIPSQLDYARYLENLGHEDPRQADVFAKGHFPTEDVELQVILASWLDRHKQAYIENTKMLFPEAFGLDVAASEFGDETVLSSGCTEGMIDMHLWKHANVMATVGQVLSLVRMRYGIDLETGEHPIAVDTIGLGQGCADRLEELGCWVLHVKSTASAEVHKEKYANKRAELYGELAARLNPNEYTKPWLLMPDNMLVDELLAPEKWIQSDGFRFAISPKKKSKASKFPGDSIQTKLGRSPDRADSVVLLYDALRELEMEAAPTINRPLLTLDKDKPDSEDIDKMGVPGETQVMSVWDDIIAPAFRAEDTLDALWGLGRH